MFHRPISAGSPLAPTVHLPELIGAFSYALDITEGQPAGHAVRCAFIGGEIGKAIGLGTAERRELHYALLLKDLGCSSNAARISELYAADDLAFKRGYKTAGTSLAATLSFVLKNTAPRASFGERAAKVGTILRNGKQFADELIAARCTRGADIARTLRFSDAVIAGIYALDEHWDGSGRPDGLAGDAIPLFARIALLAQVADVFRSEFGAEAAVAEVGRRAGNWLDPKLAEAFSVIAREPSFWATLASPFLDTIVSAAAGCDEQVADEDYLDAVAAAFGQVVDAKSPYTGGHSVRVAEYAAAIAPEVGVDPARRRWLRRGALLHDIGKLGVSNAILDKPGGLDEPEWQVMRDHAVHTQEILGRIAALKDLAPVAAAHHERLDGTGYPLGLTDHAISRETRIITVCDFYDALTADRPYRAAMPPEQALAIIGDEVGRAVDGDCFAALCKVVRA
ncbi:HD-GYP domain-containing protein [Sphingomonas piscis]|uniref:HD-GYP domain-containing protein n=1 Tax=Sphingomonas piscis TaxID=2714943 RepID=A0A6G7YQL4_9SPHN|nr:HD-GYP domain-containing protein [Sphingomonas piscis]QIK79031.1 HD-GYP domain-containing protein [Sphingomonas piscis]